VAPVSASPGSGPDVCVKAGSTLVSSCGYQQDAQWLGHCQRSPEYQSCLAGAASDCNALSVCGFAEIARKTCGGGPVAVGSATCEATGACTHNCNGDASCTCKCIAALRRPSALAFGLQGQCYNTNCEGSCGRQGSPSCDTCFQTHCGSLFDRACKGN
jgi:hypothetical protein